MSKVIMFPVRKKLPKGIEEHLYEIAKDYIETLQAALILLSNDKCTKEDLDEIHELVAYTYAKAIEEAIDNLGEDS